MLLQELYSGSYNQHQGIIKENPFKSFWMAGFECTDKLNAFGKRVDFLQTTGHLSMLEKDYENLDLFKIKTVREGIRWSQIEKKPYDYDWSTVNLMIECGKQKGIQQIWDICHFGYPDDLTPLHPLFTRRFAALCRAFVRFYRSVDPVSTLVITPINEVSFISWLGGDVCGTAPYCKGYGWEVKYALMKAYIAGVEAVKEEDDNVRLLTTEPLVNMVAPIDATEEQLIAAKLQHENQFQVLEMLCGRMCPELRGQPEYLDILGFNYYYNNQWITGTYQFLPWMNDFNDPRWAPLSDLLNNVYKRYNCPFVITETSHPGEHRPLWIDFIANECAVLLSQKIPLWGICWYPIIDRPDWDHFHPWHQSGIWDVLLDEDIPIRSLHQPSAQALLRAQALLSFK
jgi:hypothetical protein